MINNNIRGFAFEGICAGGEHPVKSKIKNISVQVNAFCNAQSVAQPVARLFDTGWRNAQNNGSLIATQVKFDEEKKPQLSITQRGISST